MKKIFTTIEEYIPEFFIFMPMILWVIAFFTDNRIFETAFLQSYWWMFLGIALAEFDIIWKKTKKFL